MPLPASYRIEEDHRDYVIIRDVGRTCLSVTNDAERVVRELTPRLAGRRLGYYDSCDSLDELLHDGKGNFLGFKHGFALPESSPA